MTIEKSKVAYLTEEGALKDIFDQSYPSFEKLQKQNSIFDELFALCKRILLSWGARTEKNGWGAQGLNETHIHSEVKNGWGGRIRTHGWRYQKPLPYRLATPQWRPNLSKYPNWNLLQNTTKPKFFALLILIFLFSSGCVPVQAFEEIDNTYSSEILVKNNRGSAVDNLRQFKDGLLYSSQNELYFNLEKIQLNTISSEEYKINNLIVNENDFYLLTTNGVFKNFTKIFNKEECFHLVQHKNKIWISCRSGIYASKDSDANNFNWELDHNSPQGVIFFTLNTSHSKPIYAASSQFGFYKYSKKKWHKANIGLRANVNGDFGFGRFLVTEVYGAETIYLPTSYGIAISNNQAKDFFLDASGIEKENGQIEVKEIKQASSGNLILISSTGAYKAKLELIPAWSKIQIPNLRKSENNFTYFSAIDLGDQKIYLATAQGEIVQLTNSHRQLALDNKDSIYGESFFNTYELIEKFLYLEPQIADVHQKALEFAGIATGETYKSYSKRARLRNLAPRFETYMQRDNENLLSIQTSGQDDLDAGDFSTSFDRVDQNRNNNSLNSGVRFTWDFTKIFYDEELIDINNNARLTANVRENLLTEVTQLYFQRKEALADALSWIINSHEFKTKQEILKKKLKLEESLAQLDARTGAWYSKALGKRFLSFNNSDPQTLKALELYANVKIN